MIAQRALTLANALTVGRALVSVGMLLTAPLSAGFYALFTVAALTDVCDGAVARRTGTASVRGARLDTAADMVFVAVCMYLLLPVLQLPWWIYAWACVIVAIKAATLGRGWVLVGSMPANHSFLNKATGIFLCASVFLLGAINHVWLAVPACILATVAAASEWITLTTKL